MVAQHAMALRYACAWRDSGAAEARLAALGAEADAGPTAGTGAAAFAISPMMAVALLADPALQRVAIANWARQSLPPAAPRPRAFAGGAPAVIAAARGDRLRVGYLSADFHEHATGVPDGRPVRAATIGARVESFCLRHRPRRRQRDAAAPRVAPSSTGDDVGALTDVGRSPRADRRRRHRRAGRPARATRTARASASSRAGRRRCSSTTSGFPGTLAYDADRRAGRRSQSRRAAAATSATSPSRAAAAALLPQRTMAAAGCRRRAARRPLGLAGAGRRARVLQPEPTS